MSNRLDAMIGKTYEKNGETKTQWTRVGVAWQTKGGTGYNLLLDAIPAPEDGQYKILLMEPRQNDNGRQQRSQGSSGYAGPEDDIPFSPEWR